MTSQGGLGPPPGGIGHRGRDAAREQPLLQGPGVERTVRLAQQREEGRGARERRGVGAVHAGEPTKVDTTIDATD